ncbi:MAG: L-rhamnose isomerase [bacterium]
MSSSNNLGYAALAEYLRGRGLNPDCIRVAVQSLAIETPAWGYGDGGTRFKKFHNAAAARTSRERIADAGLTHRLTGACPTVALHIPWDKVDDWDEFATYANTQGVKLGAINPNLFQDEDYMLGSLCNPSKAIRQKAVDHVKECIDIAVAAKVNEVSLWLADGTNYPGQDNIAERRLRLLETLQECYAHMPANMTLLVEYKFFEPAFYHTDLADWGASLTTCQALGPQAKVLVDTGHHAQGTNIEYIVSWLIALGRLGGFHFNCRKYADDDLIVASSNPFELFMIFHELINGGTNGRAAETAYMLDQSHNIENKIEAMIMSIMNVQMAYAKAMCINRNTLAELQAAGDVLGAHRMIHEAFETDVRPLLAIMREEAGLPIDPLKAFREGGFATRMAHERSK